MIVAVTSKRGGTGSTSVALILSLCLHKNNKKKVCLVDLKMNNDIGRLVGIKGRSSIDALITELGFNNDTIQLSDLTYSYSGISVLTGTIVTAQYYLYKRSKQIKNLLDELDRLYDVVVLDMDDGMLYQDLKDIGMNIFPVHVLEQNMLVIKEYQDAIQSGLLPGYVIVNKLDNAIYPEQSQFLKNFRKDSLYFLPYTKELKSMMNSSGKSLKNQLDLKTVGKTQFFQEILNLSQDLAKKAKRVIVERNDLPDDEDSMFAQDIRSSEPDKPKKKKKKKSFFSMFVGGR